jgi:hypothetical protein
MTDNVSLDRPNRAPPNPKQACGARKLLLSLDPIEALLAERQRTHGEFTENARISQALKQVFRQSPEWERLTDVQREGLERIALKLARFLSGDPNHADHLVDAMGYISLMLSSDNDSEMKR